LTFLIIFSFLKKISNINTTIIDNNINTKENVTPGEDNALPGSTGNLNEINFEEKPAQKEEIEHVEPTAEEKANVSELLRSLGL
jgi:hypothetical protein